MYLFSSTVPLVCFVYIIAGESIDHRTDQMQGVLVDRRKRGTERLTEQKESGVVGADALLFLVLVLVSFLATDLFQVSSIALVSFTRACECMVRAAATADFRTAGKAVSEHTESQSEHASHAPG